MKTLTLTLAVLLALGSTISGGNELSDVKEKACPVKDYLFAENIEQCFKCHTVGTFEVRKVNPLNKYKLPDITGIGVYYDNEGKLILYYLLGDINDAAIYSLFDWLRWHPEIKNVLIEIQSPGGSLLNAWRCIGIIEQWKANCSECVVETRVNGLAASAGLLIFMAGEIRSTSPTAELMWHEVSMTGYGYQRSTSSNATEKAKILTHLQDTATAYIANKCDMTQQQLLEAIQGGKEFWVSGREAKKLKIAIKLLWGNDEIK